MGLAPGVLWLTTIGWGLPFHFSAGRIWVPLQLCSPVNKMDTIFTLLNMRVRS